MRISYNWLKDYIDIKLTPEQTAEVLTDIGLEVEDVVEFKGPGGGLDGLVVGEVIETRPHPNADRLKVTLTDIGTGQLQQIVCGAPNVVAGQKVVVATVGATLHPLGGDPFEIKKAKIRGEESLGMICAEDEIGLGESHDGIMVLPADAPVGQSYKTYAGFQSDWVFEIGLTPNRADATGHIGVARDLQAALTLRLGKEVKYHLPAIKNFETPDVYPITLKVEDTEACPRYSGIYLTDITVSESPDWLKQRLTAVGLRPINNVVDVTNYILLEFGQPLHAFDADAIAGNQVIVKQLEEGTVFKTLDEQERKLSANDLMICNAEGGMCIAGVFGGADSGVTESTKAIFLESAYFNSVSIRKTAGRHNLRTDAAQRYEKGTDPNITIIALKRAVNLLQELAGAKVASGILDEYPVPVLPFKISLNYKRLNSLIGHPIDAATVKQILTGLDIVIDNETDSGLGLSVPPFKVDVTREADVIEEVLRVYGINNIPFPEQLRFSLTHNQYPDKEMVTSQLAGYLAGNGFLEIMTNPIIDGKYVDKYRAEEKEQMVPLLNSLTHDLNALRTTMLFSGLHSISHNLNRKNADLKLFEFGKTYHKLGAEKYQEPEHLVLFLTGSSAGESWKVAKQPKVDIYQLKAYVEGILAQLGITGFEATSMPITNLQYGLDYQLNGKTLVTLGAVDNKLLKDFDIEQAVFFADINWGYAFKQLTKQKVSYKPVSRFPTMRRDLALLLDRSVSYAAVEKIAWQEVKRMLKSVNLFDTYEDAKLGEGKKSYAVSYVFEDEQKTLTDKDVDKVMQRLIRKYEEELNAEIRS